MLNPYGYCNEFRLLCDNSLGIHLYIIREVDFGAEGTGFNPSSERYNGGRGGVLNLKRLSDRLDIGHFIRSYILVMQSSSSGQAWNRWDVM